MLSSLEETFGVKRALGHWSTPSLVVKYDFIQSVQNYVNPQPRYVYILKYMLSLCSKYICACEVTIFIFTSVYCLIEFSICCLAEVISFPPHCVHLSCLRTGQSCFYFYLIIFIAVRIYVIKFAEFLYIYYENL